MGKELIIDERIFQGIEDGRRAFCGPHAVQIDLTDRCNSNCLCCWVHSPRLNKKEIFPEGEKELPFELVKRLIEDIHRLGVKDIMLSGSGEPFIYPRILEVIELIKSKAIYLNIITNGILLDGERSEVLVKKQVDMITASVWAGTPATYQDLHPGKDEKTFERIKENLKKIASYKKSYNSMVPHIKIYNVICSKNCFDIEAMVDFAKDVKADSIEFQIVDIIKNKTEDFALNEPNRAEVLTQFENLRKRKDIVLFGEAKVGITELKDNDFFDMGKIWIDHKEGFTVERNCVSLTCKKGYKIEQDKRIVISASTSIIGTYPFTFRYKFKDERCRECGERDYCLDEDNCISIKHLNILNVGFFASKLSSKDIESGIYEADIISQPCYMGWYYARILTNGDVIPCCKAALHPLGNIEKNSFPEIWNSPIYNEFRLKAKSLAKTDSYFSAMNCVKSCDNRGMNLCLSEELRKFTEKKIDA